MVHYYIKERQSEVQRTGESWENEVLEYLQNALNTAGLIVVKGRKKEIKQMFWDQLNVPTNRQGVWGDIDLIVYRASDNRVIAVVSCKVSLHGRLTESLFYWLLFRKILGRQFRFVIATNDRGRGQGLWKSEWGSPNNPTKDRELAEKYTDGVYVKNPRTHLGGILKPLETLAKDILVWNNKLN